jgi:hypothetical protein
VNVCEPKACEKLQISDNSDLRFQKGAGGHEQGKNGNDARLPASCSLYRSQRERCYHGEFQLEWQTDVKVGKMPVTE